MYWHIFYDNGFDVTSDILLPEDVPVRGAICIVQERPDGRKHILSGKSHYVHDGISWIPCTWDDVEEYLLDRREEQIVVIRGRVISAFEFDSVFQKAKKLV